MQASRQPPRRLLLATDRGLRRAAREGGRTTPGPRAPGPIRFLARDGRGRVWLGGDGVWLVHEQGGPPVALDLVPGIGRRATTALTPDPDNNDGIIVGIGPGVVLVRVR
jgi:hypothetical protein